MNNSTKIFVLFFYLTLVNYHLIAQLSPETSSQKGKLEPPVFGDRVDLGLLENDEITEASGIIASKKNPDVFWVHNDSGGDNVIYALNNNGEHLGVYTIDGVSVRDWEDIAIDYFADEDEHYLFIGDIGDNNGIYTNKYIYKIPEPVVQANQSPVNETIYGAETITFNYENGEKWNSETLLIDPLTHDIYIVTKRFNAVDEDLIFRIPYPQSTSSAITIQQVTSIDIAASLSTGSVGGDVTSDGSEILIKTYSKVYYWERSAGQNFWEAFNADGQNVFYIQEPQGEALCWQPDRNGYFTVSEEPLTFLQSHLYFYPREPEVPVALQSFSGELINQGIHLVWVTGSESNSLGFYIERKFMPAMDTIDWDSIGFVPSIQDSTHPRKYEYFDNSELINGIYLYRLKQVDLDGSFDYSDEIEIEVNIPEYMLSYNYPNPFNSSTTINYYLPSEGNVELKVFDNTGRLILEINEGVKEAGFYKWQFETKSISNLSSGNYYYQLSVSDEKNNIVYTETKSMTYLK